MAEILIRLGEPHADPKAWQRFYPVAVKPDGHEWGSAETYPTFAKLRITNATVEQCEEYLAPDDDVITCPRCNGTLIDPTPVDGQSVSCRRCAGVGTVSEHVGLRKFKFDFDDAAIPAAVLATIQAGEVVAVTKAQILNFIKSVR